MAIRCPRSHVEVAEVGLDLPALVGRSAGSIRPSPNGSDVETTRSPTVLPTA